MTVEKILAFDFLILIAAISPGPAFVLVARTALHSGKTAGALVALGVVLAASLLLNLGFFGLAAIFKALPWSKDFMRIAGAIYLAYLGVKLWLHARDPFEMTNQAAKNRYLLSGMAINLTNPKAPIYVTSIIASAVPASIRLPEWGFLLLNHFIIEFGWLLIVVIALSSRNARSWYFAQKHIFDRICALSLMIISVNFLL